ncbi:ribonuclease H-like protein [Leucogyrophana mollusca]|uniref:Ribonuclease H-like protein n=1 Tax=Leucogyrophana mollusca TaxID=85980 RepID=A0ACB8BSK7_9AGAM|nr:ribonuclease H-like protein [Leucogyrophana mollusca]
MSVRTYTFRVELLGSRNPVISRTFSVPATWTFQRLNAAIQYTFGWQHCHLQQFTFELARSPRNGGGNLLSFAPREQLATIHMSNAEFEDDWGDLPRGLSLSEKEARLRDFWAQDGKHRQAVTRDGRLADCYFLYDFGDNWEHEIKLVSTGTSRVKELKVIDAVGCGPVEDSGGVRGWDEVKRAFSTPNPNAELRERKRWAREVSGLGENFNPAAEPSIVSLNAPGMYDRMLQDMKRGSGDDPYLSDDIEDSVLPRSVIDLASLPRMPRPAVMTFGHFGPRINCEAADRRFVTHEGTHPLDLFTPAMNISTVVEPRWVHTDNTHLASVLIFIKGAAVNDDQPNARAGCGLVFRPGVRGFSFSLENIPGHPRTSNRAELRAAVAALQIRYWNGEGFKRIVIGTDADYVVRGVCEWMSSWCQRGWRTSRGEAVKNRDLWEKLMAEIERWEAMGVRVQFYLLKKEWNIDANRCAKQAAEETEVPDTFTETIYISAPLDL